MSDWTGQSQGTLEDRYEGYLAGADDGHGNDNLTGRPLLTFEEWLDKIRWRRGFHQPAHQWAQKWAACPQKKRQ